jgi:DNA-binding transcriptional LysR family regulator
MLKDFTKLETFLVVVKERSFSKASAKLGISQPAVTQQIKFIEDYLDSRVVERKKNGIKLTKEGEDFYKIVVKLSKAIQNAEKDIIKIINKEFTFKIGASFTIGHYILPRHVEDIKDQIKNDVFLSIDKSSRVIKMLEDKNIDVALVDIPVHQEGIVAREWMEDELVIFSNQPIPSILEKEDLFKFNWICRDEGSPTRQLISEAFEEIDVDCSAFNVKGIVDNSTLAKETISHCIFKNTPTVSIISRAAILKELKDKTLFEARLKDIKLSRKLYIAYSRDRRKDAFIDKVIKFLASIRL